MSCLVLRKILSLLLPLIFIALSASSALAQAEKTSLVVRGDFDDKTEEYLFYFGGYYKDKTSEEIWHDYVDTMSCPQCLGYLASSFREPFKSWAVEEILKLKLDGASLVPFLRGDFPLKVKETAIDNFFNSLMSDTVVTIYVGHLNKAIDVLRGLDSWRTKEDKSLDAYLLVDKILQDTEYLDISVNQLRYLLKFASNSKKPEIAQRIINSNPDFEALKEVSNAKIDFYSEIAENMILQLRDLELLESSESNDDRELYLDVKEFFLEGKMRNKY